MHAFVMTKYGDESAMQFRDMPVLNIKDDECLVEIHAASVNPVDIKIRRGDMKRLFKIHFPHIMGHDIAGKVVKVGSKVSSFKVGDEVYALLNVDKSGAFAEFAPVQEKHLALKPKNLTFAEAASLPLVGLTVYQALVDVAQAKKGQSLFVKAGSGGIGTFAIQFAKTLNLKVATTTSTGNVDWVKGLGADDVIDYKTQQFEKVLKNYDVVLDSVDNDDITRDFSVLKPGGHLISIVGPPDAKFAREQGYGVLIQWFLGWISRKVTRLSKKTGVRYTFYFVQPSGEHLKIIAKLVEEGKIKPVIDRTFPFEKIPDAFAYFQEGHAKGKVVIQRP